MIKINKYDIEETAKRLIDTSYDKGVQNGIEIAFNYITHLKDKRHKNEMEQVIKERKDSIFYNAP